MVVEDCVEMEGGGQKKNTSEKSFMEQIRQLERSRDRGGADGGEGMEVLDYGGETGLASKSMILKQTTKTNTNTNTPNKRKPLDCHGSAYSCSSNTRNNQGST